MAIHFLSIHGLKDFVVEPAKIRNIKKVFKQRLGDKRPDMIGFKDDVMYLLEVKFRFYQNNGRKALSRAIFQINTYFRKLKKEVLEEHIERRIMEIKKVAIIVGFDHRINQGYIIYWRE